MAVDSKSAVDDPNTKSAVGDSSVSIGSVYMSEDINSARPYVAVNEGHVFHATLKHLKIRDPTSEKSKNISRPIFSVVRSDSKRRNFRSAFTETCF